MEKEKDILLDLSSMELKEITGGGGMGKFIGWIKGFMHKAAMSELEVNGYINPFRP